MSNNVSNEKKVKEVRYIEVQKVQEKCKELNPISECALVIENRRLKSNQSDKFYFISFHFNWLKYLYEKEQIWRLYERGED